MAHTPQTREPEPIPVKEVGKGGQVPFFRAFEWIAKSLTSFRERPLPGSYTTQVQPTLELFGSSRISEYQVEEQSGTLGSIEETFGEVAAENFRLYLSFAAIHDDPTAHDVLFMRVMPTREGTFPVLSYRVFPQLANGEWAATENILVPPEGRIGVTVRRPTSMNPASRITIEALFIDFLIGEPSRECQGGSN